MSDESPESGPGQGTPPAIDSAQAQYALEQLRSQQNLLLGTLVGVAAALVGAVLWAAITVVSGYQIGFMAVGVGFLVGYGIRVTGKGVESSFGVVGGALSLLGCALGNLLAVSALVAQQQDVSIWTVLEKMDLALAQQLMLAFFSPIDLLFYGIAVYEGYRLAFRQLTPEELERLSAGAEVPPAGP